MRCPPPPLFSKIDGEIQMSQDEKPKVALDNGCPCCGAEVTDFTRENEETYESQCAKCRLAAAQKSTHEG